MGRIAAYSDQINGEETNENLTYRDRGAGRDGDVGRRARDCGIPGRLGFRPKPKILNEP